MITGRVEEWFKNTCISHNCPYYYHEDYPYDSYCSAPQDCILINKTESEVKANENSDSNNCNM